MSQCRLLAGALPPPVRLRGRAARPARPHYELLFLLNMTFTIITALSIISSISITIIIIMIRGSSSTTITITITVTISVTAIIRGIII